MNSPASRLLLIFLASLPAHSQETAVRDDPSPQVPPGQLEESAGSDAPSGAPGPTQERPGTPAPAVEGERERPAVDDSANPGEITPPDENRGQAGRADEPTLVVPFDPSKQVVRPEPVRPGRGAATRGVPQPKHFANPEADLFDHAELLAKNGLWPLAEKQYRLYIQTYPNKTNTQAAYYGLAEARLHSGKTAEAEKTYRALLAKFTRGQHVGAANYRLATIYYRRQDHKRAAAYFEAASKTATREPVRQSAAFFRARCLQQLGHERRSQQIYQRLASDTEEHPYRDASAIILARMDVHGGRHQQAYEAFVKLSQPTTAPNIRAEALTEAGLMAATLNLPEEARKFYDEILKLDTEDAQLWHPKAFRGLLHLLYQQGQHQELLDQYHSRRVSYNAPRADPQGQAPVLLVVAHAFCKLEQYRPAASLYDQLARLDPGGPISREASYRHLYCLYKERSPFFPAKTEQYLAAQRQEGSAHQFYHLALLLKAESIFNGQQKTPRTYAAAAEVYAAIHLKMIPEEYHPLVTYKLGWAHAEAGAHEKGVTAFSTFLANYAETQPELVSKVLAKRGQSFSRVTDYQSALKDFEDIIARDDDDQLVYFALQQKALVQVEREDHQGTIDAFQALLDRFPKGIGTSEANFFIGDARYKLGAFKDAISSLTKARQLNPDTYTIPATRRIIVSHWRLSDSDNAAKEVDLLLAKDPKTNLIPPKLWLWLGMQFFQQDKFEEAARYLQRVATPQAPKDTWPLAWSFLGKAYLMSGKYAESIAPFDHYLATEPALEERAKVLLEKATSLSKIGRLREAREAAEEVHQLQKQGRTYGQAWILLGDIAMAQEAFETASKYYVIPSRMFKDPLVTPVALEKAAIAFEKMEETQRGADLRRQLRDEWPAYETKETPP